MGVKVREKPQGSGNFWVFINHQGKRKSKKVGTDEKLANEVAEKIKAKLVLGELEVDLPPVLVPRVRLGTGAYCS